jgi:large repetitive protein
MYKFYTACIKCIIIFSAIFFNNTKTFSQSSQSICNTYTPVTNPSFPNLSVTSSQVLNTDQFVNKTNLTDPNLTNFSRWSFLAGGNAFIEIKDNNAISAQVYPSGSYAGFVVDDNTVLQIAGSIIMKTYLGALEQESVSSSSLVIANILSGSSRIGFVTTKDFDRVRIIFSGLAVAGNVNIYYAEIKKFCEGVLPECNTITAINNPLHPTQLSLSNTGFSGATVGLLSNAENIVSADKNDYAVMSLPVGILASGSVAVKNQIANYPIGYFAGFDIANSVLSTAELFNSITVSTYLNGILKESKSSNNLIVGSTVLSSTDRNSIGFITSLPFNEIKLTLNQTVALNVGVTNIYNAVIQKFCEGPALACNLNTVVSSPTFPLIIANKNTGFDGVGCLNCTIQNTPDIIDTIITNYATINVVAGAVSAGKISIKNPLTLYPSGTFAAFDIENLNLLTGDVLNNFQINFLNNDTVVQSGSGLSQLIATNSFLLNGSTRFQVGMVSSVSFNEVQIKVFNTANIAIGLTKIYNLILQKNCAGNIGCNSSYILSNPNFPVFIEGTKTGINGVACGGCSVVGVNNVITSNTSDYARINLMAGALESGSISVRDEMMVFPVGTAAGFIIRDPNNFLQANLFNALTISTYLNGVLQQTKTAADLLTLDAILINLGGGNILKNIGFITSKPFNEIRIVYSNILGALTYLDVFGAYVNTSSIPFGTVGFDCDHANPDFNVTFRNIPVNGNVHTNDKVNVNSTYGNAIAATGETNPSTVLPVINSNGAYSFIANTPGVYRFYIPVCTDTICKNELLQITVLEPSIGITNLPTANTDIALTPQNGSVIIKSLVNDGTVSSGFSLMPNVSITDLNGNTSGNTKYGGTAIVNSFNGDITFNPAPNFVGVDTIKYTVCDNQNPPQCNNAFQIVTVLPQVYNNTLLAADDYVITTSASSATGNVKFNDIDPEGNNVTVSAQTTSITGKGTLVLNENGSFMFTPFNGYVGPVDFVYTICDDALNSACANATLHIIVKLASPDLTPSTRISNGTFIEANNTTRDFVIEISELLNVATDNNSNPIQVRLVKSDNFSYTFNPSAITANTPSIIPVQNSDWELITNTSSVMVFQLKAGKNISSLNSSKFALKLQVLSGAAVGTENQTIGIINGSGAEINFNNNAVVRIINIEN